MNIEPSISNDRRKLGEFRETPERTILSQATKVEGATTIPKGSRAQASSKRPASQVDDDIVCSSWGHEEITWKRRYRNTRNSTYGAMLSEHFRFGRKELGASVTACGRMITTHMMETIHSLLEPEVAMKLEKHTEVDDDGKPVNVYTANSNTIIYGDTDSLVGESEVKTNYGSLTLEALFNACPIKSERESGKQFGEGLPNLQVLSLSKNDIQHMPVKAVYRHKVSKARWKITLEDGKTVEVTNDHSIMVERDGKLMEVKASDICESDVFICVE